MDVTDTGENSTLKHFMICVSQQMLFGLLDQEE
jgi:hypothetical protein